MLFLSYLISKLNNAIKSNKKYIFSPNNSFSMQFLKLLVVEGFISSVVEINSGKLLQVYLKYNSKGSSPIKKIVLVSTLNKASFLSYSALTKTEFNGGSLLVSTNKGLHLSQDCLKFKLGGSVICFIS